MGTLQVDAFSGGIRRDQYTDIFILFEKLFYFSAFVAQHPAVNGHHGLLLPKQSADLIR